MSIDPTLLDVDDTDDDDDDDEENDNLPTDPSILTIGGKAYNLKDPDQVNEAHEKTMSYRQQLQQNQLKSYEGHSTDWGGGGRSRLLYDQCRVELAIEYHTGKHDMTWQEQHENALETVKIVAISKRHNM